MNQSPAPEHEEPTTSPAPEHEEHTTSPAPEHGEQTTSPEPEHGEQTTSPEPVPEDGRQERQALRGHDRRGRGRGLFRRDLVDSGETL